MTKEEIADDIRNKITPFKNLIAILENGLIKGSVEIHEIVLSEMVQCKKNITYLQELNIEQSNSIESLIDRNYNAQIRRGQITTETDLIDCIEKIREEFNELYDSYAYDCGIESCDPKELSDIILTCFTTAKHFNIDILQVLSDKVDFNEKRED